MTGTIIAVCVSEKKGERKRNVGSAVLRAAYGIEGDAHAGTDRQVSLLADESVDVMRGRGVELKPGDFAENLTVRGLALSEMKIRQRLMVGDKAVLEVTHKGKECHTACAIRKQVGDCVMPREGVFARVIASGPVKTGDIIILL